MITARSHIAQGGVAVRPGPARAVARRGACRRHHRPDHRGRGAGAVPLPARRRPGPAALLHHRRAPAGDRARPGPPLPRHGLADALRPRAGDAGAGRAPDRGDGPHLPRDHRRRRADPRAQALLDAPAGARWRASAASTRSSRSSTAPTAPPSARSSRASRPSTPRWPRRSAAGCSCSRTSSGSRTARCSSCCARWTPLSWPSPSRASARPCATRSPPTSPSVPPRTCVDEIDLLGPVRLVQVEEAQQAIIQAIRSLEEQGQIMVRRGSDDDFVV